MEEAMRRAEYERMEDGTFFAHVPGFEGLWASGRAIEDAREELWQALDGWIYTTGYQGKTRLPDLNGTSLNVPPRKIEE
jgi:predicted RNase H-like HicB family nuclease